MACACALYNRTYQATPSFSQLALCCLCMLTRWKVCSKSEHNSCSPHIISYPDIHARIISYRRRGGWNRKHKYIRDLGRPHAICAMLGMQSHVVPSIIETRSQIETWWQMPELQRTQTPGYGPTQRFHACTNSSVRRIVQLYPSKFFSNYGGNEQDQVPDRPP